MKNGNPLPERIGLGISSCLLGATVRYDGGHKRDAYVTGTLSKYFDLVPVCPEVAIGLGTPRPPLRLVRSGEEIRVRGVADPGRDVSDPLRDYGRAMAARLDGISGYVFKRGSPSCGMERVKVYGGKGRPAGRGAGAYAVAFMAARPLLPCEEEGRLGDPGRRENFFERVFVFRRWQELVRGGLSPAKLIAFHGDHRFLVLSHSQSAGRRLGRLVAAAGRREIGALGGEYASELMRALRRPATRRGHRKVLEHLFGFVSRHLDAADRAEMVELLDEYHAGLLPLVVPITRFRQHLRRHPHPGVERQVYLHPHPKELMLGDACQPPPEAAARRPSPLPSHPPDPGDSGPGNADVP